MKLTKGMFNHESVNKRLMGLTCGQMRSKEDVAHNGGWYNKAGEKLGWGDLAHADIPKIQKELEEGELFIVLGEHESFWDFVDFNPGIIGAMCHTKPTAEAPGPDYVAEKCRWIFTRTAGYWINEYSSAKEYLGFKSISREEAKKLVLG